MAQQTINVGAAPNDGTGTPLRTAFQYTNSNFSELYTAVGPSGNNIVVPGSATITGDLTVRTTGLVVGSTATGIGITPNTWSGAWKAAQVGRLTLGNATTDSLIGHNFYNDGSYRFAANDFASYYDQVGGAHVWGSSVTSGTAGNAIGWTVLATLNSTGLGVGVSPAYKLDVRTAPATAAIEGLRVSDATRMMISGQTGATYSYIGIGGNQNVIYSSNSRLDIAADGQSIFLRSSAANYLNLDASGNVGIGVTPSAWTSSDRALQFAYGNSIATATSTNFSIARNAQELAGGWTYSANGFVQLYNLESDGAYKWYTAASGTAGNVVSFGNAKMTLDTSGNLLVGTTTSLQNTSHSFKALGTTNSFWASTFQHDGTVGSPRLLGWRLPNSSDSNAYFVYAINSGGNCFNVFGNGSVNNSTGTYGTISDLRLKENISDARNYLADLLKLRVVKYSLKSEQSAVATKLGFVAQEVEQVFPTLVETNGDDVKSIKTSILIPMLLKAIQELTARVQTLETR